MGAAYGGGGGRFPATTGGARVPQSQHPRARRRSIIARGAQRLECDGLQICLGEDGVLDGVNHP